MIPDLNRVHETRHRNNIPAIHVRHGYFKNSFFRSTISECNKLDWKIRNSGSHPISEKSLLNIIQPCANGIFNIHNLHGIKFLTRLSLSFTHLRNHKFRHWFQNTQIHYVTVVIIPKQYRNFFSTAQVFYTPRQTLLNNIRTINEQILSHGEDQLIQTFLYGNPSCNLTVNRLILNEADEYLI